MVLKKRENEKVIGCTFFYLGFLSSHEEWDPHLRIFLRPYLNCKRSWLCKKSCPPARGLRGRREEDGDRKKISTCHVHIYKHNLNGRGNILPLILKLGGQRENCKFLKIDFHIISPKKKWSIGLRIALW